MNNHDFGVDLNFSLIGQVPNSVDRKGEVDSRDQVKQAYDHEAVFLVPNKVVSDSK